MGQSANDDNLKRLHIRTSSRCQFVDITSDIQLIVSSSGITDGLCTVFIPHTTAGITINENADPSVVEDIINTLGKLVPASTSYLHIEGNSDAHIKSSLMGHSINVIVKDSRLVLGTWQGIYFCEFDGPRNRHVFIKISK